MLLAFDLFTSLFQRIDSVTATFVTDISSKAIVAVTPVVTVGLTLAFIVYGFLVIRGAVEMPVTEFIGRAVRIAIIVSVAAAGGLYQTQIAEAITTVADDLALVLVTDPGASRDAGALIDTAAGNGFDKAGDAYEKGGFFVEDGFAYYTFAVIILLATGILAAIGGAFIIIAKIALAVLAGLGPLFIFAMLFQPTYRFFELWVAQVVNYGLLVVLFAMVFGLIMSIYGDYIADLRFDGEQSVYYAIGGAVILSVASIVLLLQLPSIASGLAGGVALGYYWELRSLRGLAGSAARSARPLAGALNSPRTIGQRAGAAARATAGSARAAGQRIAGYFRGRR